jgi:hypothetical protein
MCRGVWLCVTPHCTLIIWTAQDAAERTSRLQQRRDELAKQVMDGCKQYRARPGLGGPGFHRSAALDLTSHPDSGRMTPATRNGVRLYEVGMQAKVALEARLAHLKQQLERVEDWVCSLCAATNTGLTDQCQNIVKSGKEVASTVCVPCCLFRVSFMRLRARSFEVPRRTA